MPLIDSSAAHRSTRSETLVWAIEQVSEQSWCAEIEIPRSHWLCHPAPSRVPVTLLAEAFRQAGLAICVAGLGMGNSVQFVVSTMTLRVETDALFFPRFGALQGQLEVTFAEIRYRKDLPYILEVDYLLPGVASGHVGARVLAEHEYRAIRRHAEALDDEIRETPTELIEVVDRTDEHLQARLAINEADPFFFDHQVDHLPGMLLLHASALVHEDAFGEPPRFLTVSFPSFGELRAETAIEADFTSHGMHASFVQGDRTIATSITDVSPSGGDLVVTTAESESP
ncbi:AfsA-related hotdog domain-containing protein [Humibacter sp.]|uniref:AfsA-related hotdog domain-containing protein n=1 Tax=Humibacter sp. TaxID=1940291 RepID=UPI002CDB87FC|nr:AfsA-related hotdog domain-containing protein [Humibacter sp.]HVX07679.1 AfsA-related hotdog domain-containing protein [Humibacter sp.]